MTQTHILQLNDGPFESIKNKTKTIEMRLFDEKRQQIKVGDTIKFLRRTNNSDVVLVKVLALHRFDSFHSLYSHFDKLALGYKPNETAKSTDMAQYYAEEEIKKYGVVGIEIEVI